MHISRDIIPQLVRVDIKGMDEDDDAPLLRAA
jgi:hypothetical protein